MSCMLPATAVSPRFQIQHITIGAISLEESRSRSFSSCKHFAKRMNSWRRPLLSCSSTSWSQRKAQISLSQRPCDRRTASRRDPHHQKAKYIWAINFVQNKLGNWHHCKMTAILVEYNPKTLCASVRLKMTADNGLDALQPLLMKYRKAEYIRSNNGSELSANHLQ